MAVAIAARLHGVPATAITAPTRGRGWRPNVEAWEAKKHAIHACVVVSGCTYAQMGRLIGMHRDTVASHCADVREEAMRHAEAIADGTAMALMVGERRVAKSTPEIIADAVDVAFGCGQRELAPRTKQLRRAQARAATVSRNSSDKTPHHENVIDSYKAKSGA